MTLKVSPSVLVTAAEALQVGGTLAEADQTIYYIASEALGDDLQSACHSLWERVQQEHLIRWIQQYTQPVV